MRPLSACVALALIGLAPARAQSPDTRALVARAKSDSAAGHYAAALARLKAAAESPADRKALGLAAAQVHLDWADSLTPIRAVEALEHARTALALYRALDPRRAGDAFMEMGIDYDALGLYRQAVAAYRQAIALYRGAGTDEQAAGALHLLGAAYDSLGQPDKAFDAHQQALARLRQREQREKAGEGALLSSMGLDAYALGRRRAAASFFQQALALFKQDKGAKDAAAEALGDLHIVQEPTASGVLAQADVYDGDGRSAEALTLLRAPIPGVSPADAKKIQADIAGVEFRWGMSLLPEGAAQAIPHYQAALAIDQKLHSDGMQLEIDSLGNAYADTGQYEKAIGCYQQERATQDRERDDQALRVDVFSDIGRCYSSLGQYDRAISFFQQSFSFCERFGDKKGEAVALRDIDLARKHVRGHWVPDADTVHEVSSPSSRHR